MRPGEQPPLIRLADGRGKLQVQPCPQCPVSDGRPEKGGLSQWGQCRFEDHPTALVTPVHSLVAIARNGWSRLIGMPGRNQLESVWAMQIARRRGMKKAIVALARRLTVIMHRIWVDGTEFRWTREQAAAAA